MGGNKGNTSTLYIHYPSSARVKGSVWVTVDISAGIKIAREKLGAKPMGRNARRKEKHSFAKMRVGQLVLLSTGRVLLIKVRGEVPQGWGCVGDQRDGKAWAECREALLAPNFWCASIEILLSTNQPKTGDKSFSLVSLPVSVFHFCRWWAIWYWDLDKIYWWSVECRLGFLLPFRTLFSTFYCSSIQAHMWLCVCEKGRDKEMGSAWRCFRSVELILCMITNYKDGPCPSEAFSAHTLW